MPASLRRRRSWISSAKRKRRKGSSKNYNDYKKNKQGRNEQKS
jgi:hypothetical protein